MMQCWQRQNWKLGLVSSFVIIGVSAFSTKCSLAQIVPDKTLPSNERSQVKVLNGNPQTVQINGGATRNANLFHSFEQFSIFKGGEVHFNHAANIQNIISRVTGSSASNIDGLITAKGTANLFLLNPNGIIFGSNASLNIGGSFLASTASSLLFADKTQFSATAPQTTPLLTVSVPIGLQFGGTERDILVQESVLAVKPSKSLALVGGLVNLEGGNLQALGGRVELGGLAAAGTVGLNVNGKALLLSFPDQVKRADVSLNQANVSVDANVFVDAEDAAGDIAINAHNIDVLENSRLSASTIDAKAGEITLNATGDIFSAPSEGSDTLTLNADGNSGVINIQGKSISLSDAFLSTTNFGGVAGSISLHADDSVSLASSFLLSNTGFGVSAGDINIQAKSIYITDFSQVNAFATSGISGNININASDFVKISSSSLNAFAFNDGKGGNISIRANSISLDNGAELNATTGGNATTEQGNITLEFQDLVLLSGASNITTNAQEQATGGNIRINTNTLVALEDSDITANGVEGMGGNIRITTRGLFLSADSEITATSEMGIDGVVEIKRPENNPNTGLVDLLVELVDATELIAQGCSAGGGTVAREASEFIITGRGGLPPTPTEALRSDATLADLGTPVEGEENLASAATFSKQTNTEPTPLIEAQGWVIGSKGELMLTAQAPTVTPHIPWLQTHNCNAS